MICIIDCGTSWLKEIEKNVKEAGYKYKIINLKEIKECDFKQFSGVIISGAPTLLTEVNLQTYLNPFKFIKTTNIPLLGICLGHQIIGLLYGSKINKGKLIDKKEAIKIVKKDKIFTNIDNNSLFREEHSEYISLPKEFYLLAKSDSCDNEVMKHKTKEIYGTQFHPEVSGEAGIHIFENFLKMCSN